MNGVVDVEVVVEAVVDGRTDAELGVRVDLLHGLRHDVRGGVTEDVEAVGRGDLDSFDGVGIGHRRRLVLQLAVDAKRHHGTVGEQVESGLRSHEDNPIRARTGPTRRAVVDRHSPPAQT